VRGGGEQRRFLGVGLLLLAGCPQKSYGARAEDVAVGEPQARMEAEAIVDQYRDDRELGDELYNDKVVEIRDYRVDSLSGTTATMRYNDYELRLSLPLGSEKKVKQGDTLLVVCEGDGMEGDTVIEFERCRLERSSSE
jgi:hypothetical protein